MREAVGYKMALESATDVLSEETECGEKPISDKTLDLLSRLISGLFDKPQMNVNHDILDMFTEQ